jgi:tetratricopeptide (TPR) repeat protein
MAKNKITRKQLLKEPDEFLTITGQLIGWAKDHTRAVIWAGAVLLVLVIGLSSYGYVHNRHANTAEILLGQAVTKYQSVLEAKDATAALAAVRSDFDTLIGSYGRLPGGRLGNLIYGHICLAGQAYDDAIAHYMAALSYYGAESSLGNIILNGLGTAYLQKGEYPQAVEQFKRLVANTSTVLKDNALFNLGHLYKQLGQAEESQKAYQQLSADFPQSMYATLAKEETAGS